jgi:hypothetical protein
MLHRSGIVLLLALLAPALALGQLGVSASIVRFTDATGNVITAGDDSNNALRVNVVAGSGGGVTHIDDAAFTVGTDDVNPVAGLFDDTTPDSVDEDDAGLVRMSANRVLYTTLRDAAGAERGANVNASNQLEVAVGNNPVLGASSNNIGDVDVLSFPDNEPFDLAQYGGSAVGAGNAFHVQPGTGASFDIAPDCDTSATFDITAGTTEIVALAGGQTIKVCHISLSWDAVVDFKVVTGTGANCATGTTDVTGTYQNINGVALDLGSSTLDGLVANALCITQTGAANGGGVVVYAQE